MTDRIVKGMAAFGRPQALDEADKLFIRGEERSPEYALLLLWGHGATVVEMSENGKWIPMKELKFPIRKHVKLVMSFPKQDEPDKN